MPIDQSQIIPYFAQTYMAAQRAVDNGDHAAALRAYQQLLDLYREMEHAGIESIHRELAHDQLTELYDALTGKETVKQTPVQPAVQPVTQTSVSVPTLGVPTPEPLYKTSVERMALPQTPGGFSSQEVLLIGAFLFLIGLVVFVKPEFIGLATADTSMTALPIETTFTHDSPLALTLAGTPTSLRVSGSVTGPGTARIFYVTPQGRKVVYDNAINGNRFVSTCVDTCVVESAGKDVALEVEVVDAQLTLGTLHYGIRGDVNQPPRWISKVSSISLARDTSTILDMHQLFLDPDGDALGFIAGDSPGVSVSVSGNHVTFRAHEAGDHVVSLVASDGKDATTGTLRLHVQ